jgi:hypothetical protein
LSLLCDLCASARENFAKNDEFLDIALQGLRNHFAPVFLTSQIEQQELSFGLYRIFSHQLASLR